jgi:hypothetical protein
MCLPISGDESKDNQDNDKIGGNTFDEFYVVAKDRNGHTIVGLTATDVPGKSILGNSDLLSTNRATLESGRACNLAMDIRSSTGLNVLDCDPLNLNKATDNLLDRTTRRRPTAVSVVCGGVGTALEDGAVRTLGSFVLPMLLASLRQP